MAQRRVIHVADDPTPPTPTGPCAVHLRRADGLDLEVSGAGPFVTATLERLLVVLGVVAPPA
jgi:hypothetical protein